MKARKPMFRARVDLMTTDVIVRDGTGQFIADLKKDDFEVFEDGVKQEIASFDADPRRPRLQPRGAAAAAAAGRHHPAAGAADDDAAGRIFLFFVDDLHLQFPRHGRDRAAVQEDVEGPGARRRHVRHRLDRPVVDRDRPDLRPQAARRGDQEDYRQRAEAERDHRGAAGAEGPIELRYRAHVAFSTAYDIVSNLEKVHNRRKALVYVSNGYDFNPFEDARFGGPDLVGMQNSSAETRAKDIGAIGATTRSAGRATSSPTRISPARCPS